VTWFIGAAKADITPPVGCVMGGYGARKGRAESIAAPLYCRAFVFDDGASKLALAVCDLVFVTYDISSRSRQLISGQLGIPASCVMVTGTHTHSGPAGLTVGLDPVFTESVSRKIAGAVGEAFRQRQPAWLKYAEVPVTTIGQNRRDPDGLIEATARLLIAEHADLARPLATIVNYACHATVLEYDNLALSPDFPGAVAAALEQNVGGQAAYLQGCAGSINPVWMRHDHDEARRIGSILGLAAARVVEEAIPLGRGLWSVNLSMAEDVAKPPPTYCRLVAEGALAGHSESVRLAPRFVPAAQDSEKELAEIDEALNGSGDAERRKTLLARRAAVRMELYYADGPYQYAVRGDAVDGGTSQTDDVEVQTLRIGAEMVIVGLPGEPFLEIGEEIRRRSGIPDVLVAGYANEAIGYIPVASEFPLNGYEVGCARFTPEAAQLLVEGGLRAIDAVKVVPSAG
jgi:Neutral/alkaline non-lysosomal ceramidase, N-terminal